MTSLVHPTQEPEHETAASDIAKKAQLEPEPSLPQDATEIKKQIPTNSFRKNPARSVKPKDPAG